MKRGRTIPILLTIGFWPSTPVERQLLFFWSERCAGAVPGGGQQSKRSPISPIPRSPNTALEAMHENKYSLVNDARDRRFLTLRSLQTTQGW